MSDEYGPPWPTLNEAMLTLRADAALPAAGAFDASPTEVRCDQMESLVLYLHYQRGSATGEAGLVIEVSPDTTGDTWYKLAHAIDATLTAGVTLVSDVQDIEYNFNPVSGDEKVTIIVPLASGAQRLRVPCQETGDTANPGDLEVRGFFTRA